MPAAMMTSIAQCILTLAQHHPTTVLPALREGHGAAKVVVMLHSVEDVEEPHAAHGVQLMCRLLAVLVHGQVKSKEAACERHAQAVLVRVDEGGWGIMGQQQTTAIHYNTPCTPMHTLYKAF